MVLLNVGQERVFAETETRICFSLDAEHGSGNVAARLRSSDDGRDSVIGNEAANAVVRPEHIHGSDLGRAGGEVAIRNREKVWNAARDRIDRSRLVLCALDETSDVQRRG